MPRIRMEAIIPKHIIRLPLVRAELLREMDRQIGIIDRMYGKTYRTWRHKPQFRKEFRTTRESVVGQIATIDVIYHWVEDGTRAHIILPRSTTGVLNFPSRSRPKTKVRTIGSGGGFRGARNVFSTRVFHPGTKPRKFTQEIVKRRSKFYTKQMQAAVKRGVTRRA